MTELDEARGIAYDLARRLISRGIDAFDPHNGAQILRAMEWKAHGTPRKKPQKKPRA
jgi:hypothetical protein